MSEFTFLDYDQVFGPNKLDIIKLYGTKCPVTDFAILLGGRVAYYGGTKDENIKNRAGYWWIKSHDNCISSYVNEYGYEGFKTARSRDCGARPCTTYSSIEPQANIIKTINEDIIEVHYGNYPQTIVDSSFSEILENAYNECLIKPTGKHYTTDSVHVLDDDIGMIPKQFIEYEYMGHKYIRMTNNFNNKNEFLSDGTIINPNKAYWVEVEPISWIVSLKNDLAIPKKILFAGVQLDKSMHFYAKFFFNESVIKKFMDEIFSQEICENSDLKLVRKK